MPIAALNKAIQSIDINKIMSDAFSAGNIQQYVKETILQRLRQEGITGSEKKLQTDKSRQQGTQAYSMFTEMLRESKGKQTSHVDLYSDGDLHKSFKVTLKEIGFVTEFNWTASKYDTEIAANFTEMYADADEFYNDVESLTPDELDEIALRIYKQVENKLNEIISR